MKTKIKTLLYLAAFTVLLTSCQKSDLVSEPQGIAKSVNVATAGTLKAQFSSIAEWPTVQDLTVTGTLDATDFAFMRDSLTILRRADLSGTTITSVPANAFYNSTTKYGCKWLQEVDLPATTITLGANTFLGCAMLQTINIPAGVTVIPDYAFYQCSSLTKIDLPAALTSIGLSAFEKTAISSIAVPNTVTTIKSYALANTNLTSFTFPESLVTANMGTYVFFQCGNLLTVTFPAKLTLTLIPAFTFHSCAKLQTINLPATITAVKQACFGNCSGLTSIVCNAAVPPAIILSTEGDPFYGVTKTIPLKVPSANIAAYQAADGWKAFTGITTL
jgi:hypothetical protein